MRTVISERMRASVDSAAHAWTSVDVDFSAVEQDRKRRNETLLEHDSRLTPLTYLAWATTHVLERFPRLNAHWDPQGLVLADSVELGIAVDLDHEGLVVPRISRAEDLLLRSLADRIATCARKARDRKLGVDDMSGTTFTISALGSYGTAMTMPIINHPEVAIMGMDAVKPTPVAVEDETSGGWIVAVRPVGRVVVGFDHRANDGAYCARFLTEVKAFIEDTDWSNVA